MNKKILYIVSGIAILMFLSKKASAMTNKFSFDKFKDTSKQKLLKLQDSLISTGLGGTSLKLALAQLLVETGNFTSKSQVATLNNNYSGIKYINKPYQVASKGSPVPAAERVQPETSPYNYYAKFDSPEAWAKDFKRILSLGTKKPILALDTTEYVKRLKNNHYFGGNETTYLKNINYYFEKLT